MEDIAKMADECLRDIDEDEEDGSIEEDQDLLVFAPDFHCVLNPCVRFTATRDVLKFCNMTPRILKEGFLYIRTAFLQIHFVLLFRMSLFA